MNSIFMKDSEPNNDLVANAPLQQVTVAHWLPSVANNHAPVTFSDTSLHQHKVGAYADLQNPL